MSQSFEGAPPAVVKDKHKYRGTKDGMLYPPIPEEEEGRQALNIMYDKRVFRGNTHNQNILKQNLNPSQKEEQRIKEEREKKKIEMIKAQLMEFKKSKNTTSPYDLRPGPPARIEVDLTYFLTEQGKTKADEAEVKLQTDVFQPKPPTPKYIPKKTGIDKITQIEDYDLFDYDIEVQPILDVLLNKSIDQAVLEVEEEHELEEIRKFKYEYHQRRQLEDTDWQHEVKREISRIKQKNKALENAREKRKQQFETMQKLQCMNIAKNFLSTNFLKSMQSLADNNHWRDSFKDQLNIDFKDWMYDSIAKNLENKTKSSNFKDDICNEQLNQIGDEKNPIKQRVKFNLEAKEKSRQIESVDKRTVHFLFNTGVSTKISPFARKFEYFLDGKIEEKENEEKTAFEEYVEKMQNEELEEGEENPVKYGDMPFFHCELTGGLSRLSFSTADDPFYKTSLAKYYPEVSVFDKNGTLISQINHKQMKNVELGMNYLDDIRDPVLKINDDRKIQIQLGGIKDPGTVIVLCIREFDNTGKPPPKEDEFKRAWFRLSNEETNQTIDYSIIENIDKPDDYNEFLPQEDEEAPPIRNDLTYLHGLIYLEETDMGQKWVFESFKHSFQAKDYPNLSKTIGELYANSISEYEEQQKKLENAQDLLKKSLEQKRLDAIEAAKKAKAKAKKKGKGQDDEPVDDGTAQMDNLNKEEDFDYENPASFERALKKKIPRPFVFGPVEFDNLNKTEDQMPFDPESQREQVKKALDQSLLLPSQIQFNGFKVTAGPKNKAKEEEPMINQKRTLKRRTTLLKHARFLQNLEVFPVFPSEPEPKEEEENPDESN